MILNYIKLAFRLLLEIQFSTFINVLGVLLGLLLFTSCGPIPNRSFMQINFTRTTIASRFRPGIIDGLMITKIGMTSILSEIIVELENVSLINSVKLRT